MNALLKLLYRRLKADIASLLLGLLHDMLCTHRIRSILTDAHYAIEIK